VRSGPAETCPESGSDESAAADGAISDATGLQAFRRGMSSHEGPADSEPMMGDSSSLFTFDPAAALDRRHELLLMSIRGLDRRGLLGPAGERIYVEIAIAIIDGRLRPGTSINSVELASQFGSSRTPVREALGELERQGVIVIPPRRRPYTASATLKQARDIYELQASLYSLASELVVRECSTRDLDHLRRWQDALERDAANDAADEYFWHHMGFRLVETRLAGNFELQRMISAIGLRTLQFRHICLSLSHRVQRSVADHRRLLTAYEERDASTAAAITRSLVMSGYKAIEQSGLLRTGDERPEPARSKTNDWRLPPADR
jgi:DNA-binding GntR family transcriptional regulator